MVFLDGCAGLNEKWLNEKGLIEKGLNEKGLNGVERIGVGVARSVHPTWLDLATVVHDWHSLDDVRALDTWHWLRRKINRGPVG